MIKEGAIYDCLVLTSVILNDGLEEIGRRAFKGCAFVRIDIPPSVRMIKNGAFSHTSLLRIDIPPNVRTIEEMAFCECSGLMTVILGNGLEEIGARAFSRTSLVRIDSPPQRQGDQGRGICQLLRFDDCDSQ